jgi:hypothetical protein
MLDNVEYLSMSELEAGMEHIRQAPKDHGTLKMIVRRPQEDERDLIDQGELSPLEGLVGDSWKVRGSKHTPDGSAALYAQITIMNARCAALLAQSEERWALAGDQLYVDFDLGDENIPSGSRLAIGSAIIEVSAEPHTGCKFSAGSVSGNEVRQLAEKEAAAPERHQRKGHSGWHSSGGRYRP